MTKSFGLACLISASLLGACSSSGGGKAVDAPGSAAAMITVSGTTSSISTQGTKPLGGVMLQAFREGETTAVASATSDATTGAFTMMADTGGTAFDGYILAKADTYVDSYLYPPAPLSMDYMGVTVFSLTSDTLGLAALAAGESGGQDNTKAFIALEVEDSTNAKIAGATITATPAGGKVHYNGTNGLPDGNATSTQADGTAYVFNQPAGTTMVNASKQGATFHAHSVNARAGVVTLTIVQ